MTEALVYETGWARSGLAFAMSDQDGGQRHSEGQDRPGDHKILIRIFPITRWAPARRNTANRAVGG